MNLRNIYRAITVVIAPFDKTRIFRHAKLFTVRSVCVLSSSLALEPLSRVLRNAF